MSYITHDLVQGSPEWHAFRTQHFAASEAPAMMGVSPYKTRSQLLAEKASGVAPEVDAMTQRRFDAGHRFEALARPLAEAFIGDDLYPVTVSEGKLSASLDGLTMDGETVWEHKTLNQGILNDHSAGEFAIHHRIQMEQQLMLTGAKQCLFTATSWDENGSLLEEVRLMYTPDMKLRNALLQGWAQFAIDMENYVPPEIIEKPKAETIMAFPALAIQIRGEVTTSNLPAFREAATAFIAQISTDLKTDEDFAQAEATVKFCKAAEDDLDAAKKAAIGQTASIDELMRTIDHIQGQLRDKRLVLDKLVKTEKEAIRQRICLDAANAFRQHVLALEKEIAPLRLEATPPDLAGAIKNKRTMASLHDAVKTSLAQAIIAADALSLEIRCKQAFYQIEAVQHRFLFADMQQIIGKPLEDFKLLVSSRIAAHNTAEADKLEAERKRIQAEEEAKARAKIEEEATAKQKAEQEDARIKAEAEAARVKREQEIIDQAAEKAQQADHIVHTGKVVQIDQATTVIQHQRRVSR
ncbi:MAG: YqaJ viral recombinase family protein [Sulfuricellaceae bacterium]|nr:YqaJ viral recombinase family protein [Sulfuricellaceae bacterium]